MPRPPCPLESSLQLPAGAEEADPRQDEQMPQTQPAIQEMMLPSQAEWQRAQDSLGMWEKYTGGAQDVLIKCMKDSALLPGVLSCVIGENLPPTSSTRKTSWVLPPTTTTLQTNCLLF